MPESIALKSRRSPTSRPIRADSAAIESRKRSCDGAVPTHVGLAQGGRVALDRGQRRPQLVVEPVEEVALQSMRPAQRSRLRVRSLERLAFERELQRPCRIVEQVECVARQAIGSPHHAVSTARPSGVAIGTATTSAPTGRARSRRRLVAAQHVGRRARWPVATRRRPAVDRSRRQRRVEALASAWCSAMASAPRPRHSATSATPSRPRRGGALPACRGRRGASRACGCDGSRRRGAALARSPRRHGSRRA